MSDRTDKAHAALADALVLFEEEDRVGKYEQAMFLLRVAETQAAIAQAEATERIVLIIENSSFAPHWSRSDIRTV